MSLNKCGKKAHQKLDQDDRKEFNRLVKSGMTEVVAVNNVMKQVLKEKNDLVKLLEKQGVNVAYKSTPKITKLNAAAGSAEAKKETDDNIARNHKILDDMFEKGDPELLKAIEKNLSKDSPIIKKYLEMGGKFAGFLENMFSLNNDMIGLATNDGGFISGDFLDVRKLDWYSSKDAKMKRTIVEHEITHFFTSGYIARAMFDPKNSDKTGVEDIRFFNKAIFSLVRAKNKKPSEFEALTPYQQSRINYIIESHSFNPAVGIAELVAIVNAEPDAVKGIETMLSNPENKGLINRIKAFFEKMVNKLKGTSKEEFKSLISIEELQDAVQHTVASGTSFKENQRELSMKYQIDFINSNLGSTNSTLGANQKYHPKSKVSMDYVNQAVYSMVTSRLERKGKSLLGTLDTNFKLRYPLYAAAAGKLKGIYDDSSHLQSLVHTITGNNINKLKKADILAKFAEISAEHIDTKNEQLSKFHTVMKTMDDSSKKAASDFINKMPLHDYFILASDLTTGTQIQEEINRLEKLLRTKQGSAIKDVEDLVNWHVHDNITGNLYNLETRYPIEEEGFGEEVRKLLALKSIEALGFKRFEKFLKNKELIDLVKDTSVANRMSIIGTKGATGITDSMVPDYYKEPVELKAIELDSLPMYEYGENTGWKILRTPTSDTLGIVYRHTIDSTDLVGAYTDIKLSTTDIDILKSDRKANYPGVMQTSTGYKLVLSHKEKQKLGLIEDFSEGLVRGATHSMAIKDSQIIRDELLKADTYMRIQDPKGMDLVEIVNADNIDNPWFVKLNEDQTYSDLDPAVKAKYMPVGTRISNVNNFNNQVDLVRKDISHWLLGGKANSLSNNPHIKWAIRITKDLIAGAKIGMVVLNPVKIANDNVSNVAYLATRGVDPLFIAKNYSHIMKDYSKYQDLKRQVIQLKVKSVANPESVKIKKQIKSLQDRIKNNPVGDLADKGFINSLGSDLVAQHADTLSGLHSDAHTAIKYLMEDSKGNKNVLAHFLLRLQDIGFNGENFLSYIGGLAKRYEGTAVMGKELDKVADRLKEVRSDKDIINYVSQYTTSPGSEAVRVGAGLTDLSDVLAKETLYRHLVESKGMSPDDARIDVLDSFPDYKENMPLAIKQLSDMGILMFPSFWMRIQKTIYRLGRDNPVNLGSELLAQEVLGSHLDTILDANIINKASMFGGIIHTPLEYVGVGSVVPEHLF